MQKHLTGEEYVHISPNNFFRCYNYLRILQSPAGSYLKAMDFLGMQSFPRCMLLVNIKIALVYIL